MGDETAGVADAEGEDLEVLREIVLLAEVIDLANASGDRVPAFVLDAVLNRS